MRLAQKQRENRKSGQGCVTTVPLLKAPHRVFGFLVPQNRTECRRPGRRGALDLACVVSKHGVQSADVASPIKHVTVLRMWGEHRRKKRTQTGRGQLHGGRE